MKLILTLFFAIILKCSYSQTLGIQETISYINNSFLEHKTGNYYETLTLYPDGMLNLYYNYSKWTYKMHVSEVIVGDIYDNKFKIECKREQPENKSDIQILLSSFNQNNCIEVEEKSGARRDPENYILVGVNDVYDNKKLYNAFKYLFSIIEENGSYLRNDDDPFAPKNFKKTEISYSSNNNNINLEKIGGVYYVLVTIGKTTKKFILDSGASDVLISEEIEKILIDSKFIDKSNYLPMALYKIADGSIIQCRRILLPELKVGNLVVKNVVVSVGKSNTLLLGKSLLDKFGSWTIDNNSQKLKLEK